MSRHATYTTYLARKEQLALAPRPCRIQVKSSRPCHIQVTKSVPCMQATKSMSRQVRLVQRLPLRYASRQVRVNKPSHPVPSPCQIQVAQCHVCVAFKSSCPAPRLCRIQVIKSVSHSSHRVKVTKSSHPAPRPCRIQVKASSPCFHTVFLISSSRAMKSLSTCWSSMG